MIDVTNVGKIQNGIRCVHGFKDVIGYLTIVQSQRFGPILQVCQPADMLVVATFIERTVYGEPILLEDVDAGNSCARGGLQEPVNL